ncbi:MAG: hypothetical protein ACRDNP_13735, partial [Gaiellaceae bacterium]
VGVPGDEDSDLGCEGTSEWRALAGLESAPNQLGFVRVADVGAGGTDRAVGGGLRDSGVSHA